MRPGRLFIFGLGYTGLHVAKMAQERGWHVSGTCRSASKAEELQRYHAIDAFALGHGGNSAVQLDTVGGNAIAASTHILSTVPATLDERGDPILRLYADALLSSSKKGPLRWAGYLSTTGVYGDHAGEWVDELSETRTPASSSAAVRLQAEREWQALWKRSEGRLRSHVFRLAGIYGPGRSALDTVARAAEEADVPGTMQASEDMSGLAAQVPFAAATPALVGRAGAPRYVSRIHVADICATLLASMATPAPNAEMALYNVADDEPAPRAEVMAHAAHLLGCPLMDGAVVGSAQGERGRRRATESKRVRNGRMRALISPNGLAFPSYREGLTAIQAESKQTHKTLHCAQE